MARLTDFIEGKISGKLGNFVYFGKNGNTFIRTVGKRKTNPTLREIKNRNKFAISIKLAKSINDVPELKKLWDANKFTKGSAYNAIQKANYVMVDGNDVINAAIIPDALSFNEPSESVSIEGGMLRFKLNKDETSGVYTNNIRDEAVIAGVIFMKDVLMHQYDPCNFIGLKGSIIKKANKDYAVINFDERTLRTMDMYDSFTLFFGLICGDKGFGNFSRTVLLK